ILKHGPMNARRAIELAAQIGDALADAHASGVFHGDLRPETVVETNKGRAKVLDTGLTPWSVGGPDRADTKGKPGRPAGYQAPEQKAGNPIDERTDVFALGALLFEMLAGRLPPANAKPHLASLNPELHHEIDGILTKALAPEPDDRYSCAATMVAELLAVLAILNDRASRTAKP
ncbi:MAG TPA: protein kinase, partial [Vicinamibacterales bacterium]|nr:protein kinase [Vicinamibacterales bacterium]